MAIAAQPRDARLRGNCHLRRSVFRIPHGVRADTKPDSITSRFAAPGSLRSLPGRLPVASRSLRGVDWSMVGTPMVLDPRSAATEPARRMRAPSLLERFLAVRERTAALCAPLSEEDCVVQPMPDASPAKWHLAHTTWFFEAFVLGGAPFDPAFEFLFNSYYEAVGPRVDRARRGVLTRPSLERVHAYRAAIDRRIARGLAEGALDDEARAR